MRYLGNKEVLMPEIIKVLSDKNLLNDKLSFFDAFCGSGSVSDSLKGYFELIINDNLKWSVVYTKGKICAGKCTFQKLGFDPFEYFNSNKNYKKGFIYKNYSLGESNRMYFSDFNAGRIDYFRYQIEDWKKNDLLTEDEYNYLLACLIESVSSVSNTAGVYGAFLKKWDSRALKDIKFDEIISNEAKCSDVTIFNNKIENIISEVECDILYLDPPYTQNQYGTQYHLLETLILDDNPNISKITGSRPTGPMRSDWSKEYKAHILFDKILAKTKAKYILFSYSNNGIMSKEFIEASLKRYGKKETYLCKKIPYKKYQNWKSKNQKENFEYLFFIEKQDEELVVYESPLNYIGSKAKIVNEIKKYVPKNINSFIDAFAGGFNVGININADKIIYNDLNYYVKDLVESFEKFDTYEYIKYSKQIIKKFRLEKSNSESYINARNYYNSLEKSERDPRFLFTLILYGFQQQIRFNNSHNFNNPVGMRWFNDKVLEKLVSFSRRAKENNYNFLCDNYTNVTNKLGKRNFVYLDPPYMLTTGSYNDGKRGFEGWNEELEDNLFQYANGLNSRKIPFMLSYVHEHAGKTNEKFHDWVIRNDYNLISLGEIVGISGSRRKEVLVTNYEL